MPQDIMSLQKRMNSQQDQNHGQSEIKDSQHQTELQSQNQEPTQDKQPH